MDKILTKLSNKLKNKNIASIVKNILILVQ